MSISATFLLLLEVLYNTVQAISSRGNGCFIFFFFNLLRAVPCWSQVEGLPPLLYFPIPRAGVEHIQRSLPSTVLFTQEDEHVHIRWKQAALRPASEKHISE